MPIPTANKFLSFVPQGRRYDQAVKAIESLERAQEISSIRKVELEDAKSALGNALKEAWDKTVAEPFFHAGKWQEQPEGVYEFYVGLNAYSLHDCIATSKKLAKTKLEAPVLDVMRELMQAALPIAEVARDLKEHIVAGRAPKPAPDPKPNPTEHVKVTGTCGCCQRDIAVGNGGNGNMAHHGYSRPGWGYQTASCPGTGFKSLEKSLDGLNYMIETTARQLDEARKALAGADDLQEVKARTYSAKLGKDVLVTVLREQPHFPRALAAYKYSLESEIRQGEGLEAFLDKSLVSWTKFHEDLKNNRSDPEEVSDPTFS